MALPPTGYPAKRRSHLAVSYTHLDVYKRQGFVKFLFPNSHSIYLHDTPSKSLFNETNRAFSHGCIRLAEPQKLATYLLRSDTSWTENKIKKAMNAGVEKTVTLKKPEPVFIAYFTAWVAQDGQLNLRKDIYQRDTNLLEMILK